MLTPWTLLSQSDAAAVLAVWAMLVGCVVGAGVVLCFGWRRLTRPGMERMLRLRLDEAGAEIRRLRQIRKEQDAVAAGLYAQVDRLAKRLVLQIGEGRPTTARKGVA